MEGTEANKEDRKYARGTASAATTSLPMGTSREPLFNLSTNHKKIAIRTPKISRIIFENEKDREKAGMKKNGNRAITITINVVGIELSIDFFATCMFELFSGSMIFIVN